MFNLISKTLKLFPLFSDNSNYLKTTKEKSVKALKLFLLYSTIFGARRVYRVMPSYCFFFLAVERGNQHRLRRTYRLKWIPNHFITYKYFLICSQQIEEDSLRHGNRTYRHQCVRRTLYLLHHSRLQIILVMYCFFF